MKALGPLVPAFEEFFEEYKSTHDLKTVEEAVTAAMGSDEGKAAFAPILAKHVNRDQAAAIMAANERAVAIDTESETTAQDNYVGLTEHAARLAYGIEPTQREAAFREASELAARNGDPDFGASRLIPKAGHVLAGDDPLLGDSLALIGEQQQEAKRAARAAMLSEPDEVTTRNLKALEDRHAGLLTTGADGVLVQVEHPGAESEREQLARMTRESEARSKPAEPGAESDPRYLRTTRAGRPI